MQKTRFHVYLIFPVVMLLLSLGACTKKEESSGASTDAKQNRVVNLAIWSNYITPEMVGEFQKRTGIKIQISNYSSNEELLGKLQAGATGYDVIVPSDYMVFVMAKLNLLRKIEYSKIPNAQNLNSRLKNKPYDPSNTYSLPYGWGTTGIAVNRSVFKGEVTGWKDLFEKPELAGKFSLLDDAREVLGAALKSKGYPLNSKNPAQLQEAKELLLKVRKQVKAFSSEPLALLVQGEVAAAHAFSSDALKARSQTGGKIDFILPKEGGTLWIDSLAVPVGAKNVEEAFELINFLLDAKINVSKVETIFTAPVIKDIEGLLPDSLKSDRSLIPSEAQLAKFEMMEDLGDQAGIWDRLWTEVKAAHD